MAKKATKSFILRVDSDTMDAIEKWAADEFRSTNGQLQWIITEALRKAVSDGDIIAITCNKPGLDIAHLGFAVWQKDGLHLLNASQIHKKVVQEPMTLYQYLQKHPSHTGIRIIRINQ